MFLFLPTAINSLKPLFIIPGLYGSSLYAQADSNYKYPYWYCPRFNKRYMAWVDIKLTATFNCLFTLLTCRYDESTKNVASQVGLTVSIEDFGGNGGLDYVDSSLFDWHFIESFHSLSGFLISQGYQFKKDLFGIPYDWRLGMAGLKPLFGELKSLIEKAYSINGESKVSILGFSLGGYVVQHLLSNYTSTEWKEKYISKAIFLAPAFGGSSNTLVPAWSLQFPIVKFIDSAEIRKCLGSMPVLHALFPNHVAFQDLPLVYDQSGKVAATAQNIGTFLNQHGKLDEEGMKIFNCNVWFNQHKLGDPGVDCYFIFNSKVKTDLSLHFGNGFDKDITKIDQVDGDGTVPSVGIKWAIANWDRVSHKIVVNDVENEDKENWNHSGLSTNLEIAKMIFGYANDLDDALSSIKNGLVIKKSPYLTHENGKWVRRDDIKAEETILLKEQDQISDYLMKSQKEATIIRGARIPTQEELHGATA